MVKKTTKNHKKGFTEVIESKVALDFMDNGGRRSGIDRRQFSYSDHIPERRMNQDRRNGKDRRDAEIGGREMERRAAFV